MRRLLLCLLLCAAGCSDGVPDGQVLVRADGIDITRRDLLVDMMVAGVSPDADVRAVQGGFLETLIARKLLAKDAVRQSIDRSPEFLGLDRRNREILLVDQLKQRMGGRMAPPTRKAVDSFVAANTARFEARKLFQIERIATYGMIAQSALVGLHSTDFAAKWLEDHNMPYQRSVVLVDSLDLSADRVQVLEKAYSRASAVAAWKDGHSEIIQVLTEVASPVPHADRTQIAAAKLRAQAIETTFDEWRGRLRARAQIRYQAGYAPARNGAPDPQ